MVREIKFKAKRVDNNEWVEGLFAYISFKQKDELGNWGEEYRTPSLQGVNDVFIPIDVDTLCQLTGIKTSYDIDIYEADVFALGKGYYGVVVFDKDNAQFIVNIRRPNGELDDTAELSYIAKHYNIKGNIHD